MDYYSLFIYKALWDPLFRYGLSVTDVRSSINNWVTAVGKESFYIIFRFDVVLCLVKCVFIAYLSPTTTFLQHALLLQIFCFTHSFSCAGCASRWLCATEIWELQDAGQTTMENFAY